MRPGRRAFVPDRAHALEDRFLLSSLGRSTFIPPPAHTSGPSEASPAFHGTIHASARPQATALAPTSKRWSWFANTYWYVPTANLAATLFNSATSTIAPVLDQTVFQITGYRSGFFWGKTVAQLGSSSPSGMSMVGSVTPQGKVLLSFTQVSGSSPSVTEGYGTMQRKGCQWTMENQMFTAPDSTLQVGHWAYMVQTHPGLPSWNHLPSAGLSVPTFLSEAPGSGPQPIGS